MFSRIFVKFFFAPILCPHFALIYITIGEKISIQEQNSLPPRPEICFLEWVRYGPPGPFQKRPFLQCLTVGP